jgi:hypothetical protein
MVAKAAADNKVVIANIDGFLDCLKNFFPGRTPSAATRKTAPKLAKKPR